MMAWSRIDDDCNQFVDIHSSDSCWEIPHCAHCVHWTLLLHVHLCQHHWSSLLGEVKRVWAVVEWFYRYLLHFFPFLSKNHFHSRIRFFKVRNSFMKQRCFHQCYQLCSCYEHVEFTPNQRKTNEQKSRPYCSVQRLCPLPVFRISGVWVPDCIVLLVDRVNMIPDNAEVFGLLLHTT